MEVKTSEIDSALENVYAASISQDEVGSLLSEIQGEQGMVVGANVVGPGSNVIPQQANPNAAQKNDVDEMQSKLDALK